ncbi:hypothetical protein OROMI_027781 [Orobanche minor]
MVVAASKQSYGSSTLNCPLCKEYEFFTAVVGSYLTAKLSYIVLQTENFSIIYGYDGTSFQQHDIGQSLSNSEFFSTAHRYRLKCYYTEPGNLADKLCVSRHWKFHKYLQKNQFLPNWLRREIQALMQDHEEDVDIIMHHILGVIDSLRRDWSNHPSISMEMVQKEFRASVSEAVEPFLTGRTERFVNELVLFLASGLSIDAFDKVYIEHLGWKIHEICDDGHDEPIDHVPDVPCYLYIFDGDSDGN